MANWKKTPTENRPLKKLLADLQNGSPERCYIFHGVETVQRDEVLQRMQERMITDFEVFNLRKLDGKNLTPEVLRDTVEAVPMMAERALTIVSDCEFFRWGKEQQEQLAGLLGDLPDYTCLVFVFDTLEYKSPEAARLKKAIQQYVQVIEFRPLEERELIQWVIRKFQEQGKQVDTRTAEYLIMTCGDLLSGLLPEIEKISAYVSGGKISQRDIDAAAIPVLAAQTFKFTDAIVQKQYDQAANILDDLLKQREEPIMIVAALSSQMRKLYSACLALESRRGQDWLETSWGIKSYQAKRLLESARHTHREWCGMAVKLCQDLDLRMKSEKGIDREGELKMLLLRLWAARY